MARLEAAPLQIILWVEFGTQRKVPRLAPLARDDERRGWSVILRRGMPLLYLSDSRPIEETREIT